MDSGADAAAASVAVVVWRDENERMLARFSFLIRKEGEGEKEGQRQGERQCRAVMEPAGEYGETYLDGHNPTLPRIHWLVSGVGENGLGQICRGLDSTAHLYA